MLHDLHHLKIAMTQEVIINHMTNNDMIIIISVIHHIYCIIEGVESQDYHMMKRPRETVISQTIHHM